MASVFLPYSTFFQSKVLCFLYLAFVNDNVIYQKRKKIFLKNTHEAELHVEVDLGIGRHISGLVRVKEVTFVKHPLL